MYYVDVLQKELTNSQTYTAVQLSEPDIISEHLKTCDGFRSAPDINQHKLPTMYWIPKLHKTPYKARFIANSSSCTTTKISKLLTSCLTTIKDHVKLYCDTVYENSGINMFWSIINSTDVLSKLENEQYHVSALSTYDFSTLYTTLPHHLIKEKLNYLIEHTFTKVNKNFIACNDQRAFFSNSEVKHYTMWTCLDVCRSLTFLLDNIFVRFGNTIYRQIVGIPMGTNCAPLVADLFLYCYERDFMLSLQPDTQADVICAFNKTSRYLDDILNLDNPYFETSVTSIYPKELTLNKANNSDSTASFLDLNLSITNNIISSKIYDKREDFNFDIVNYPFLDGDVPRATSYGVYISQLIRFARACSSIEDFNHRNLVITEKLLKQGYRYHKLRKTFSKFYHRNPLLIGKYKSNLRTLLRQGISHPEFYGDVIYKLRNILGHTHFNELFSKRIKKFVKKGYDPIILQRTACLVIDPSTVGSHASLFHCTTTDRG